ncbi:hypothetical protein MJO29_005874 [Puccinia striiformis f. sp. tritici]|nr:hypothetical protein MJO29_005874 [Puccinia striiformis f. sp. tritici]
MSAQQRKGSGYPLGQVFHITSNPSPISPTLNQYPQPACSTPTRHHPPMAQLASEETPSTPPNTTNVNDSTDWHPPQSIRRESTRLRTPSTRPGFIPTITDSRQALVPAARPGISRAKKTIVNHSEDDIDDNDDGDGGNNDGEDEDEEGDDDSDFPSSPSPIP